MEINNRLNEIACQNVLTAELAALPGSIRVTGYHADEALLDLPISSKFNGEADFLSELFQAGRRAASDPTTHRGADGLVPALSWRGGQAAWRCRPAAAGCLALSLACRSIIV